MSPGALARRSREPPRGTATRNWRGQCKDWSLEPGDRDYDLQQRIIASVNPRDPRREQMTSCGEPGWTGHPERCRHPACRVCLARERKMRVKAARTRFEGIEHEVLRSGTFLLAATDRLEGIAALLKAFRSARRNRVEYQRRRDARWESVACMATLEIALFRDNDLPWLPIETRQVLRDIGFPEGVCGGPVWLVHVHALVHVGEVEAGEVRAVLADILPGHRRVMLKQLDERGATADEVRRIVSYPHKSVLARRDPDADGGWSNFDDEELALYVAWAGSPEGRFMERRFWLGPTRAWLARRRDEDKAAADIPAQVQGVELNNESSAHRFRISSCPRGTARPPTRARRAIRRREGSRGEAARGEMPPATAATRARDPPTRTELSIRPAAARSGWTR